MSKGEVPIAYIIALILGIAVVALLGYWFFVMQAGGSASMNLEQCRAKAYEYCSTWASNGYSGSDSDLPEVGGFIGNKWFAAGAVSYVPQCASSQVLSGDGAPKATDLMKSCKALLA